MMIKIFLISAFVATSVNAGWKFTDDLNDQDDWFPRLNIPKPHFPDMPPLPAMPNVNKLISKMKISSQDVASHKESGYTGTSITYSSDTGYTVVTNNGGNVRTYKGKGPNPLEELTPVAANEEHPANI